MPKRTDTMNLESLHAIATMVAQQRSVDAVLETVVESLVDSSDLALACIWLVRPGDICADCPMRDECPNRARCLHLVASAGGCAPQTPLRPQPPRRFPMTPTIHRNRPAKRSRAFDDRQSFPATS